MRKFVAACCCVIVGLEVLIGVPLVVCVFAFAYMEAAGTTVTVQSQPVDYPMSVCSNPAVVPAPNYSNGYASTPSPTPLASTGPWAPVPSTTPAVCPPPPSPEVTAIAEVRQQNGSPLDGTIVAPVNPTSPPSIWPFIAAVEQVAAKETACLMPPPVAPTEPVAAVNPVEPNAAPAVSQPGGLVEALRVCSEQLYVKANDLEANGEYGRADEVRSLARRIRQEIQTLVAEAPVIVPSTVTAAAFDPQKADPAAVEPAPATPARGNSIPLTDPTVPSAFPPEPPQPASEEPILPTIPAP
jgi:hypothetical protein